MDEARNGGGPIRPKSSYMLRTEERAKTGMLQPGQPLDKQRPISAKNRYAGFNSSKLLAYKEEYVVQQQDLGATAPSSSSTSGGLGFRNTNYPLQLGQNASAIKSTSTTFRLQVAGKGGGAPHPNGSGKPPKLPQKLAGGGIGKWKLAMTGQSQNFGGTHSGFSSAMDDSTRAPSLANSRPASSYAGFSTMKNSMSMSRPTSAGGVQTRPVSASSKGRRPASAARAYGGSQSTSKNFSTSESLHGRVRPMQLVQGFVNAAHGDSSTSAGTTPFDSAGGTSRPVSASASRPLSASGGVSRPPSASVSRSGAQQSRPMSGTRPHSANRPVSASSSRPMSASMGGGTRPGSASLSNYNNRSGSRPMSASMAQLRRQALLNMSSSGASRPSSAGRFRTKYQLDDASTMGEGVLLFNEGTALGASQSTSQLAAHMGGVEAEKLTSLDINDLSKDGKISAEEAMHERWMLSRQKELEERVWEGELQDALRHWREFRSRVEENTARRQEERTANLDVHADNVVLKSVDGNPVAHGVDTTLVLKPTDLRMIQPDADGRVATLNMANEAVLFPTAANLKLGSHSASAQDGEGSDGEGHGATSSSSSSSHALAGESRSTVASPADEARRQEELAVLRASLAPYLHHAQAAVGPKGASDSEQSTPEDGAEVEEKSKARHAHHPKPDHPQLLHTTAARGALNSALHDPGYQGANAPLYKPPPTLMDGEKPTRGDISEELAKDRQAMAMSGRARPQSASSTFGREGGAMGRFRKFTNVQLDLHAEETQTCKLYDEVNSTGYFRNAREKQLAEVEACKKKLSQKRIKISEARLADALE